MTVGALERECRVFARYLLGAHATTYVADRYAAAHRADPAYAAGDRFDRWLTRLAGRGGPLTRVADAYARLVRPRGVLRRKLVLLLAILETSAPSHRALELDRDLGGVRALLMLAVHGLVAVAATGLGVVLLGPVHLVLRGGGN